MLIFGNETTVLSDTIIDGVKNADQMIVFNLSNAIEKGIRFKHLTPPLQPSEDKGFDMFYAEYIMNNDRAFVEFMNIIYRLYSGDIVYVLVDHTEDRVETDYKIQLTESLIKFIQQRYGYLAYIINEPEDWDSVKESEFSIQGLYNLDIDKERFALLATDFDLLQKELEKDGSL